MSKKLDFHCKACGGRDIRIDAWFKWDAITQEWVFSETLDHPFCTECGEIVKTPLADTINSADKGEPKLLAAYARLHDMLSDMIESGRLREADIPNDYRALVDQLSGPCNAAMAKARGD
jgi:hypothetical protein